jgi:uncharacterized protein YbbC (DUF1343 family)
MKNCMVLTGLDKITDKLPREFKNKRIAILCHAPSVNSRFHHITEIIAGSDGCSVSAIFGPQHGLHGETQDNMIEWEGQHNEQLEVPVYSLYGAYRKPTPEMLKESDLLLIDLQDAAARLYTYIWTVKLCMEACSEVGIPVWILDRPNPVAPLPFDGPVLKRSFYTFVGGAEIPLCHRMTIGEMAAWIKEYEIPGCELTVIPMDGWNRNMFYSETLLPWVPPSPNLPSEKSAVVYPGTVLAEALNLSEGRGTTTPFELLGAPWLDARRVINNLRERGVPGVDFRQHNYIPTFHKYEGQLCQGIYIHPTDRKLYRPVETAMHLFDAIIDESPPDSLAFLPPPYEYEERLMPFDILAGDEGMRETLVARRPVTKETERWRPEIAAFRERFEAVSLYLI